MGTLWFNFRLFLYSLTLFAVALFATFEAVIAGILGQRVNTNYYVARTFYNTAGPIMGWKFEVEGEEHLWGLKGRGNEGSAVMVGNHQSFVDILYLGRIFPKRAAIMAKKSIKWIPGLGWFMMLAATVFINRSNNKSAIASMTQAGEDMKRKRISLWIFPEGTRHLSAEPDLLPFKKGAFYLAVQSGAPVVPVVCQNYHHLFDGKTRFRAGTLRIKVLPPIPTTGMTADEVPALMEKTRDQMVAALKELSIPTRSSTDSPSTEPLLQARPSGDYEATLSSDEATVESAVDDAAKSAKDRKKVGRKSGERKKHAVA